MILDIIVISFVLLFTFIGHRRGLIKTIFSLLSSVLSIFLAIRLYPFVSIILREKTPIFTNIKASIISALNLEKLILEQGVSAIDEIIISLPFPDFITNTLVGSNNPDLYSYIDVSSIENYIGSYIANIILNIISAILVFVLVIIIMKLLSRLINVVSGLPVINKFNKLGGLIAGALLGLIYVFLALVVLTLLFVKPESSAMEALENSKLTLFLYKNNFLIYFLVRLFI